MGSRAKSKRDDNCLILIETVEWRALNRDTLMAVFGGR
jgi:hypothetical protein